VPLREKKDITQRCGERKGHAGIPNTTFLCYCRFFCNAIYSGSLRPCFKRIL